VGLAPNLDLPALLAYFDFELSRVSRSRLIRAGQIATQNTGCPVSMKTLFLGHNCTPRDLSLSPRRLQYIVIRMNYSVEQKFTIQIGKTTAQHIAGFGRMPTGTTSEMGRVITLFALGLAICHRELSFRHHLANVSEPGIDLPR
jgi:hypothetical protein